MPSIEEIVSDREEVVTEVDEIPVVEDRAKSKTAQSFPLPPFSVLFPEPPYSVSLPSPPLSISDPALPIRQLSAELPVIVSFPDPPVTFSIKEAVLEP